MKYKIIQFVVVVFSLLIHSCEKEGNTTVEKTSNIQEVNRGTSFGFCLGYCTTVMKVTRSSVDFVKSSRDEDTYPEVVITSEITSSEWQGLVNEVDSAFFSNLPTVIGCPDCADGGAEWIEIIYSDKSLKVTYEAGSGVPGLEELFAQLNSIACNHANEE